MTGAQGEGGDERPRIPWGVWIALLLGALLAAAISTRTARAGAWTQEKGALYNRLAGSFYGSTEEYDTEGHRDFIPFHGDYAEVNLTDYVEYGLTDRLTVLGSLVLKKLELENDIRITRSKGLGDIDAALRFKLAEGSAGVASVQALVKIPTGYEVDVPLPIGNGEFEYDAHLLYGRSLWPLIPGYCGVEVGYRWRAGAPEDEIRYLAEVGTDLGKHLYTRAKLDGVKGTKSGAAVDLNGNPTIRNAYDLGTLDLTFGGKLGSHWFLEGGYAPSLYGRTTTAGSRWSLALACTL
ncbi:MAG TPA: hypothetical protein VF720_07640 [Candidatus Eisenbacteria bacterium]